MKWIKPSGIEIETNDTEAIREYALSLGWKEVKRGRKPKATKEPVTDGDSKRDS
jgi:hypothetical protein